MMQKIRFVFFIFSIAILANSCQKEDTMAVPIVIENLDDDLSEGMSTLVENFESGTKTFYSAGNVSLSIGQWNFNDALIQNSTNQSTAEMKVAHIQNNGVLSMNFDVTNGTSAVLIDYAKSGTNANCTFELWASVDGGIKWEQNGEAINVSSSAFTNVAFYMDYHHNVRFQLRKTSGGDLDIDNFTIQDNSAVASKDNNMGLGNPSNAVANLSSPNNYLLVKPQYALGYNSSKGNPKWVSWHLSSAWKGNAPRVDCFRGDETLPATCYKTSAANYNNIGFDRGHQCPSDDRDKNSADNKNTFYMTDMLPQAPNLNRITWLALESYCRTLAAAGNELYIISGGYGSGGTGSNGGLTSTVANGKIEVPARCWKVILVLTNGSNDKNRVNSNTRVIAVDMPNNQTVSNLTWGNYRVSVDAIEASTGLNLLSSIPAAIQNAKETTVDNGPTQ